jgi:hypothetical protein
VLEAVDLAVELRHDRDREVEPIAGRRSGTQDHFAWSSSETSTWLGDGYRSSR